MKKSFKILKKITGISSPVIGVSWNPNDTDRDKIKNLITYLEDRRVLFNPFQLEFPIWVSKSVIEIRSKLTKILSSFDENSETSELLRTMRSSCRRYLDKTFRLQKHNFTDRYLIENLIELRSTFGICIGKLSIMYGIDMEENLIEIVPLVDDSDGKKYTIDKKSYTIQTK